MSSASNESTSEPVYKAAGSIGAGIAALLGVLGGAVALGLLSSEQADALTAFGNEVIANLPALAAAVVTVVGIVSGLLSSFATAWAARKKTVPVDSDVFDVVPTDAGPLGH